MKKGDKVIVFHDKRYGYRGQEDRREFGEIISIGKKWITVRVSREFCKNTITFDAEMNDAWFFHGEKERNNPYMFENEEYLEKYLAKRNH